MRSLWHLAQTGSESSNTIRKFERLQGVSAGEIEVERYDFSGERIERASFVIDHGELDWPHTVSALQQMSARLALRWQMRGDGMRELAALIAPDDASPELLAWRLKGLREAGWLLRADQHYPQRSLTAPKAERPARPTC